MKDKQKKRRPEFEDDGRTIANMEYFSGYNSPEEKQKHKEFADLNLTKKERWAICFAALKYYLPYLVCFVVIFVGLLLAFYFGMR